MTFIFDDDIKKQCNDADLEVLSQSDDSTKEGAEESAISFFRGYLKRYDVDKIFADLDDIPYPDTRDASLVMFLIDYMLYILYSGQPDRLIPDIRVRRRDEAVEWLQGISKGNVSPDFPTVDTADETDINSSLKFGSNTKVSGTW
jgi:phage gp36-like protein